MKLKDIKKLHLEDYYWRMVFGKSRFRASFFELRAKGFKGLPAPVFFLSTGRCGTNWFTALLSADPSLKVFHEPKPNLGVQGKVAYEVYRNNDFNPSATEARLLEEVFLAAREQYLRYSYKTQRRFVETNNQVTFLAPAIHSLFPDTKFVHLNRHPGEFVRSALRRKFYNNTDDIKRIAPLKTDGFHSRWDTMDALEKNSWLWMETNRFIESFVKTSQPKNHFYFNFSELTVEQVMQLAEFLGVKIDGGRIRRSLEKPVNVQRSGTVKAYSDWTDKDRKALQAICGDLATKYGYEL